MYSGLSAVATIVLIMFLYAFIAIREPDAFDNSIVEEEEKK